MAHIPDGFLSAPVIAGAAVASASALAVAARRSRERFGDQEAHILGATTAFVFAAQMLNFPLGAGTSAHLIGGVLVAVLVGPWAGMLVLFSVLLVQALLFQDGGVAALGANTLNMAVLGVGGGYLAYRWLLALLGPGVKKQIAAAAGAAWFSVLTVGVAAALELAVSGTVPLKPAVIAVGGSHVVVGLAEAVLTGGLMAVILKTYPHLLSAAALPSASERRLALITTALSLVVALVAVYAASSRPDSFESAARRLGIEDTVASYLSGPFADYTAPIGGPWVAAVVGVVAVFMLGLALSRIAKHLRAKT
jgi:cobalt/nickel transport system permease protein